MEHDKQTYFTENEYDDVKGFTILAAGEGEYHIAEKWLKDDGDDVWLDYWVPESDLLERATEGLCEAKAKLTDEQFEAVCQKVDWYTEQFEEAEEAEEVAA
jgi:hypothetical protein